MEAISLLLGVISLAVSLYYGAKSGKLQSGARAAADRRFFRLASARLGAGTFSSADQVRSMAHAVSDDHGLGAQTDRQLAVTWRRLALDLDESGEMTEAIRAVINDIGAQLKPYGWQPASIANTDRYFAIQVFIVSSFVVVVLAHVTVAVVSLTFWKIPPLVFVLLVAIEVTGLIISQRVWRSLGSRIRSAASVGNA